MSARTAAVVVLLAVAIGGAFAWGLRRGAGGPASPAAPVSAPSGAVRSAPAAVPEPVPAPPSPSPSPSPSAGSSIAAKVEPAAARQASLPPLSAADRARLLQSRTAGVRARRASDVVPAEGEAFSRAQLQAMLEEPDFELDEATRANILATLAGRDPARDAALRERSGRDAADAGAAALGAAGVGNAEITRATALLRDEALAIYDVYAPPLAPDLPEADRAAALLARNRARTEIRTRTDAALRTFLDDAALRVLGR